MLAEDDIFDITDGNPKSARKKKMFAQKDTEFNLG